MVTEGQFLDAAERYAWGKIEKKEFIAIAEQWGEALIAAKPHVSGAVELLGLKLIELQKLESVGFEDYKDLERNSENIWAIRRAMRLISGTSATDR